MSPLGPKTQTWQAGAVELVHSPRFHGVLILRTSVNHDAALAMIIATMEEIVRLFTGTSVSLI